MKDLFRFMYLEFFIHLKILQTDYKTCKSLKIFKIAFFCLLFSSIYAQAQPKEKLLDSLKNELQNKQSSNQKLVIYQKIVEAYFEHPQPKKGMPYAEKALKLARQLKDRHAEATALQNLSILYPKIHYKEWGKTLEYAEAAANIREEIRKENPDNLEHRLEYSNILADIAFTYWQWGKFYTAFEYYRQSIKEMEWVLAKKPNYPKIQNLYASRLNSIGTIHWGQGEYALALEFYLKALKIYESLENTEKAILVTTNIGMVYANWNDHNKALEHYQKALAQAEKIKYEAGLGYIKHNIGKLYEEQHKYDDALAQHKASAIHYQIADVPNGIGMSFNGLGGTYQKMGKYPESLNAYQKALSIAIENKTNFWIATNKTQMASTYLLLKEWSLAEQYIKQSLELAEKEQYQELIIDNYKNLSELYEGTGDLRLALAYHKKYTIEKDSLFNEEKYKQLNQIQALYEAEKKQKENEKLKKQQLIQEKNLLKSQFEKLGLIAGLIALMVFIVYVLYSRRQLREAHLELSKRNQAIQQKNKAITEKTKELEELNTVKDRLFSIIAHDLKSPIGQLEAVLDLVRDETLSENELKHILPEINKNIRYTSDLINNLLHWAKSQMQGISVEKEKFDVFRIAQSKLNLFENSAQQKQIQLKNQLPEQTWAFADPDMVDLVLRNLVGNALKFCNRGDTISIKKIAHPSMVCICVEDSGQGIAPDDLERLFSTQSFSRRGTANEKGTGLGLNLCRDFIEKNGGEIWVESKPNEGSCFFFTLSMPAEGHLPQSEGQEKTSKLLL